MPPESSHPASGPPQPAPPPRGTPARVGDQGPDARAALSVLLNGRPDGPDPPLRAFLDHAQAHQMDLSGLWAIYDRRGAPQQAVLAVPGVGRTAMLFLSPMTRRAQLKPAAALIQAAVAEAPVQGLALVQAVLSPEEDLKGQALELAGLSRLAELLYMHRASEAEPHTPRGPAGGLPPLNRPLLADPQAPSGLIGPRTTPLASDVGPLLEGLYGESWTPERGAAFATLIEATYEDTRDCPGLRGMRHIDDVVSGHRATGVFHPGLWTLWSDAQGPVAVLLVAEAAPAHDRPPGTPPGTELVYLGVAPRGRGRGLGSELLRYALASAAPFGGAMSLAVDRDNPAARRMYRRAGFLVTASRIAWIGAPAGAT